MNNQVTLSVEEAHQVLNTLRTTQMNLQALIDAVPAAQRENFLLATCEYAGALNAAITGLEGSMWESGIIEMSNQRRAVSVAQQARDAFLEEFQQWEAELVDRDGKPYAAQRERFRADVKTLVLLTQLAEREANLAGSGAAPSQN